MILGNPGNPENPGNPGNSWKPGNSVNPGNSGNTGYFKKIFKILVIQKKIKNLGYLKKI